MMVVIDVLAEISDKYSLNEDQISLQNIIIDTHFDELFQKYNENGKI